MFQGYFLSTRTRNYAAMLALCGSLFGCGVGTTTQTGTTSLSLHGTVHGGQQAVAGSTVQLYTVGTTGNGSAALPLIAAGEYSLGGVAGCNPATQTCYTSVVSDANGSFTITGDYTCPSSTAQVYIVATGGNPGLVDGTHNHALVLLSALGSCGNLSSSTFVYLNEVTTVAAAWALAPFMTSYTNVGSSANNTVGIANAFLDANLLANTATGMAATLPSNLTIESAKLYALANVIAPCVNSDGTSGCSTLFGVATTSTGSVPADTLTAVLNIVKNPGYRVQDVFNAITPQAPFGSTLSKYPNDWTMSLTVGDVSMASPTSLGVDSLGNVWVANYNCPVDLFSPQGALIVSSAVSCATDREVYGLVVDSNSDVWVTNEEIPGHGTSGSVTKYNGDTNGQIPGTYFNASIPYAYDSTVDFPLAVAADNNGNVATANYANSSATVLNTSEAVVLGGFGSGNAAFPVAVAFDAQHGLWLANQSDNTVTHVDASGNLLSRPICCDGANGVAVDSAGNAWISSYYGSSVSQVAKDGTVLIKNEIVGGLNHPAGIALDANQNVWTVNYRGSSFTELAGINNTLAAGSAISPGPTSSNVGGYGLDASLLLPFGVALDPSGNVWISNFANNDLVMFFGLAAPTLTPSVGYPKAP
jgi:streptogramin lyase